MANVSLVPVPAEQSETTCAGCGAPLVADQRYCLACGQPCSPVRLDFLDVLATDQTRASAEARRSWISEGAIEVGPVGYAPIPQRGVNAWLRRNSGLMGLLSVLALCLIMGLLVGHWATQGKASQGPQVVKIEGLGAIPAAAAAGSTSSAPAAGATSSTSSTTKAAAKEAAEEAKAATKETKAEKAPPPAPVKVTPTKLKKLSSTTGRQHQEEVNALGAQPIETG